ncbi:hypothetical protein LIER_28053 [Lithospermum erythrorhizon]|uniref:Uncharacterized protein n=1 Tax=Lithospermum erythrorhizon TaxID=34254 RepID=A0AAV3RFV0_LITER
MANLGLGPQASYEASWLWIQAASASRGLGDGHSILSQQTYTLHEALTQERLKDQELRNVDAERDAANQTAFTSRREREGLSCAYLQDNRRRCCRIGVAVLSDVVLNCQDQPPALPALAEEYR